MDLFQPMGGEAALHRVFYSRRIGATAPILAAAKLTGSATRSLDIGMLEAVVAGAGSDDDESDPDRRFRFHPSMPLHFGLESELPRTAPAPLNYLLAVGRYRVGEASAVGGSLALATPITGRCSAAEATLDPAAQPASCAARGGNAAAVSWDLRSRRSEWVALGQLAAIHF